MPGRDVLTKPEEGLVRALVDLSAETGATPRPSFRDGLRDRLLAEATAIESEEADAFARALEGESVGDELAGLAAFASALVPAEPLRAPQSLRAGLRDHLTTSASFAELAPVVGIDRARTKRRATTTVGRRLSRRLAVAAALAGMMVSSSAVAFAASANDTPVDSLYGVKRFRERVQTWFVSGIDEGVKRVRFADLRVGEAETMVSRGVTDPAPYEVALDGLQIELTLASELILRGSRAGDPVADTALPTLATFLRVGADRLEAIQPDLPPAVIPVAHDALEVFASAARSTEAVIDGCVVCPAAPEIPDVTPCGSCGTGGSERPTPTGSEGGSPSPEPDPSPSKTPDGNGKPSPDPDPVPIDPDDPIPTPLPEPDLLPSLPGRLDDELDDGANDVLTQLIHAA